jgi:hypothetical protein
LNYPLTERGIGEYTPPSCSFNQVIINLTVTTSGRQFDRLGIMYFGDTEVWRTSTAEPSATGIVWSYVKDMTQYLALWKSPQKLLFDIDNILSSVDFGVYNATLIATFFTDPGAVGLDSPPADVIIAISGHNSSMNIGSAFVVPDNGRAINTVTLPRNANRAVFSISAVGQALEEQWFSDLFSSATDTFDATFGSMGGFGSWRELQLLIDGQLAGVAWPFATVFTGGVIPGFWRPIVGIDAFDLREREVDITPWLGVLSDGAEHTFQIVVKAVADSADTAGGRRGAVVDLGQSNWVVTGKIFLWLDSDAEAITTGTKPVVVAPEPHLALSQTIRTNATGFNETLVETTTVSRTTFSVAATIRTQKYGTARTTWAQSLSFSNTNSLAAFGFVQTMSQTTTGSDAITIGNSSPYKAQYAFPISFNVTELQTPSGNLTLFGSIERGLDWTVLGNSVFPSGLESIRVLAAQPSSIAQPLPFAVHDIPPLTQPFPPVSLSGTTLSTRQSGTAFFFEAPTSTFATSFGSTNQTLVFSGIGGDSDGAATTEFFSREVQAVNSTIISDQVVLLGAVVENRVADVLPGAVAAGLEQVTGHRTKGVSLGERRGQ